MKPSANPKRTLIESLQVGLAWDSQIKKWAERELPNGEVVGRVKNAQTVNYKTLKPVKDGLFCEKIFGPVKDFECACGFKQTRGGFCPQCNVEFTRSEVRRYRLGYFQLPSAVTHVWYLRGRPSYISYLLGIKIKKALALTYGAASLLVNSQNDKILSQEESETFTFSFTTQTLYSIGECKGKTVPRSQIRRYNSNYFLFNKKRAKLIKNFFHSFIYTSSAKILPSPFTSQSDCQNAHFSPCEKESHPQNIKKQNKQDFHLLEELTLPVSETILETGTNLQNFDKEREDSNFLYSQPENLKTSLLSMKPHDSSINSYISKPFLFSSTIRGGWQPLIVVNLQDKLPVHLSYKKTDSKYYKLKKYLKFSQNMGFYTPSFFVKQNQTRSSSLINTNWSDETFDVPNGNGLLKTKHGDERTVVIHTDCELKTNSFLDHRGEATIAAGHRSTLERSEGTIAKGDEKKTKFFFNKLIWSNKKKKVRKSLAGVDKNKELSLSTLIFYPIKKEVNKVKGEERLTKNPSELTKKFYQELDSKFKSLNFVDKTTKQIDFSSLSEKRVNLQDKFEETKSTLSFPEGKPQNTPLTPSGGSREELTDFRSLFHFIGQPCQLKKKAKFLVHTAFSFSQTRNQIFKILNKEKSINSVDFGYKLSYYGKDLKDKYRIPNNNLKKKYHQSHLLPYLFSLSCQSKNYQYLQTYSNFFTPTLSNSEKTLLISSYKNQTKKNNFLNLYDSFLKEKFTISTLFSCFDNSSTIGLKHLTNSLVMRPSVDYFAEKIVTESPEKFIKLVEENKKFSENNIESQTLLEPDRAIVKQNKFKSENIIQLQNSGILKNLNTTHDQVDDILGEIPLVLDFCQNITVRGNKNSKFFQQKEKVLQNKTFTFWELKKKTKLLHDKNLENEYFVQQDRIGQDLQSKLSETKSKAIDLVSQTENKKSSGVFNEIKKKETRKKKRKGLLAQNLKLCEVSRSETLFSRSENLGSLSKILLKLNEDSPLFLQNISVNSFFNSSKDYKFLRGFLIKKLFFVEAESQLLKNETFYKQKLRKTHQPILSFWEEKNIFNKKYLHFVKQNVPLQKVDLFKSFAEQNFPSEWKAKHQRKRILKIGTILRNFKKIRLSPVPSNEWSSLSKKLSQEDYLFSIYEVSVQQALGYTCGEAILKILSPIDCYQLESGLKVVLWQINERISEVEDQGFLLKSDIILLNSLRTKKSRTLRRLKIAKILRKTKVLPKQMVFSLLPVLPPSLRPIIQLDENIVAVSDCSQIYQKIVQRSNRLSKRMSKYLSYDHCLRLKVLLQQAVDGLIENGKGGSKPLCDNNGRPLKSLSDGLKGKKGRFRQDLLGRRVDYSGRSVIVVGPALKLHQCGLPREMAIELFQPFLIRQLFAKKIVSNIAIAKNYIKKETPIVLEILKQLLRSHPVLLNRAPTLHRLGVQAFQPKLVSGRAILLHPLVCSAFNADFDGDQMAVHIPLSSKARGEAWKILWSRNNILSPATGQPILVPSQDMVLGCYYLTTKKANFLTKNSFGLDKKDLNKRSLISFNKSNDKMVVIPTPERDERGKIGFSTGNKNINGNLESQFNQSQSEIFSFGTNFDKEQPDRETLISLGKDMKSPIVEQFTNQNLPPKGFPTENLVPPEGELRVTHSMTMKQNVKQLRQVIVPNTDQKSIVIKADKWTGLFFNNSSQVLKDLQQKRLKLHTPIWLKMDRDVEIHKEEQKPLEARINCCGNFTKIYPGYLRRFYKKEGLFFNENKVKKSEDFYVRTTCGRVMLNQTISPILHQPF